MTDRYPRPPLEFDGPSTFHVFGVRYEVVSLGGVAPEGGKLPVAATAADAAAQLGLALASYTLGCSQIAWRRHPEVEEQDAGFTATARLAVWR